MLSNLNQHRLAIHRKSERRIQWLTIFIIGLIHVAALLAFDSSYYSSSGVVLGIILYYVAGMLGVTLCFHRLLTHRSFQTYKWVEYFLTFCGVLALQSGPMQWVAQHRIHHKEADDEPDPHSPLVTFIWAHMGWLFVTTPGCQEYEEYCRFAKDLAMQVASSDPIAVRSEDVPEEIVNREREVYLDQVKDKPENIRDKIVEGKLKKFFQERCLLEQLFVKGDQKTTVQEILNDLAARIQENITVRRFARFDIASLS